MIGAIQVEQSRSLCNTKKLVPSLQASCTYICNSTDKSILFAKDDGTDRENCWVTGPGPIFVLVFLPIRFLKPKSVE